MGSWPTAYLLYGVRVPTGHELPFTYPHELEEYLVEKAGVDNPYKLKDSEYNDLKNNHPARYKRLTEAYWVEKNKLLKSCPIELVVYGGDDPTLLIALRGNVYSSDWEGPIEIDALTPYTYLVHRANEFCEREFNIPFKNPTWLLVADYG